MEESRFRFVRNGSYQERLAGARRAVEKHSLRRIDTQTLEELRMAKRQLHHLARLLHRFADTSHIIVCNIHLPRLLGFHVLRQKLDLSISGNLHNASR
jgi:hypothetical protein